MSKDEPKKPDCIRLGDQIITISEVAAVKINLKQKDESPDFKVTLKSGALANCHVDTPDEFVQCCAELATTFQYKKCQKQ
jgi:hypothetical protein